MQQKEMPKAYDSSKELEIFSLWEKSGLFSPENMEKYLKKQNLRVKKPFVMTLPPPNANGDLHLGHTCGYSFHDALGRFNRMTGHPTLLIPGKDHAGIQTETVYTKLLQKEGIDKWKLGREKFNKMCYNFCINKAENARKQERRIGLSADYTREKFTLDPKLTKVVYDTFYKLYEEGYIYRAKRIINQCPSCRTALADIDTVHKELRGIFAYIIYPFVDEADKRLAKEKFGVEGITVATTRPETMLGDTAVAVHPNDERYKEFIGKKVLLPITNREIPIIADEEIDPNVGTGALKVTPAHSPIDFEIGQRHNLEIINVIDEEGKMTGPIPEIFKGLGTIDCSKALVEELDKQGLLVKIENIKHDVAVCERCSTPIEPIISFQWFLDTSKLAKRALEALETGKTQVIPDGQQKALEHFYKNNQPWCISRQLWWGHRIPIWYSGSKELHDWLLENPEKTFEDYEKETGEKAHGTGRIFTGEEKPTNDPQWTGSPNELRFEPEEDVFDTWFSSGQWPYSTLGGPGAPDYKKYYPTDVMIHARDILFWWSGRMLMLGLYRTNQVPFHTILVHGMILAPDGSKMSKSKGNSVPPTEILDKYGADALRLWYYKDALPGSNSPLREEKIKGNRHFVNKIWNASRFILLSIEENNIDAVKKAYQEIEYEKSNNQYLQRFFVFKENIIKHYQDFKFHLVVEDAWEFFWHDFADKWIEDHKQIIWRNEGTEKDRTEALALLIFGLTESLKLMHPLIPFVTEAIWQELNKRGLTEGLLMQQQIKI